MALVKKENISLAYEKYTDKQGNEKTSWKTIGEVLTFQKEDGSYSKMMKLYSMPGVNISLFEQKPRENTEQPHQRAEVPTINRDSGTSIATEEEEINIKNIPF